MILRFGISAVLASALAVFGGGWLVHEYVRHKPDQNVGLTLVRGIHLLAHLPGHGASETKAKPQEMLNGFVQVGFTIGPDGRAHGIHIIRAEPPGQNEEAAREVIAARRFKPSLAGQKQTKVVHFQVPASLLGSGSGSGKGS